MASTLVAVAEVAEVTVVLAVAVSIPLQQATEPMSHTPTERITTIAGPTFGNQVVMTTN